MELQPLGGTKDKTAGGECALPKVMGARADAGKTPG